jgi:hypothetical protein
LKRGGFPHRTKSRSILSFGLDQEVSMQKLLTGTAVASALVLFASAGQACDFHASRVTAGVPAEEVVAMSTVDEAKSPVVIAKDAMKAEVKTDCSAGGANCAPEIK